MDFPEFLTLNLWFRPTWAQQSKGSNSVCLRSIIYVTSQRTQNISLMLTLKSIWLKQYLIYFFLSSMNSDLWREGFEGLSVIRVLEEMLARCLFITIPVLLYEIMAFSDSVEFKSSVYDLLVRSRLADINIFCLQSHQELSLTVVRSVVLSLIRDDWSQANSHYYANRDGLIIKKLEITFHTYLIYY